MAMIAVIMGIGNIISEAGLGQSIIRSENPEDDDYSTVFCFNLLVSVFFYIICFFTAPLISSFYHQPKIINIIRIYGLIFIINSFSSIHFTRLTREFRFKKEMTLTIPALIVSGIVGVSLALSGFGVWSLVCSGVIQSLLTSGLVWISGDWNPKFKFNYSKFKIHFKFGIKLALSGVLDTFFNNLYTIVIGKFFLPIHVAFYNRADSLQQLPVNNISNALNKVTFPLFSEHKNDIIKLKSLYKSIMQLVLFVIAPILLFMSILAEPIFLFLFSEKWKPAVPYFRILCWSGILYPLHSYNLNILKVQGRTDLYLKLEIIKKIIVTLLIIFAFRFGVRGLAYSSLFASILSYFVNSYYSGKFLNYNSIQQILDLKKILFSSCVSSVIVYFLDILIHSYLDYSFIRIIIAGTGGLLVYWLISYRFNNETLKFFIKTIKK